MSVVDGCSKLLSSLEIGPHTLINRIVFGPHRTNLAVQNRPGIGHVHYYEQRARGGAGLIVIEGGSIHHSDYPYERAIFAFPADAMPGYRQIARAVHRHGCCVVAQLNHSGGQVDGSLSRSATWAPSAMPEVNSGEVPKTMEREDIKVVIAGFCNAASGIRESGLDGVEINAGQYSLLRQFLSPLTNARLDEYGGSLENRARFCREVLQGIRRVTGAGFLIGLRLCGDEYAPWGGLTPEDCRDIAQYLCQDGFVDYLTVEVGSIYSLHMTMASMRYPEDYAVHSARLIAQAVNLPVCATGSIVSLELAERLVNEGLQLVEMTRALIADPFLPAKAAGNQAFKIRPCILCNQGCYVNSVMNPVLSCAVNPAAGQESKEPTKARPAGRVKKILVVGGGPAGLEAAGTAAQRGHRVLLYDRADQPGGRLRWAAKIPGSGNLQNIINYLYHRAQNHGVEFRFGRQVDENVITAEAPEVVILAAGSRPSPVPFAVEQDQPVLRPEEILAGNREVGPNVLIVDLEGAWQAPGVALALANKVEKIQILSSEMFVSPELVKNGEFIWWYRQAFQMGVELIPQTEVIRVAGAWVEVVDRFSREVWRINNIDTVVLAAPAYPERKLYHRLLKTGVEVWTVGDCVAPRNLGAAVREGRKISSGI